MNSKDISKWDLILCPVLVYFDLTRIYTCELGDTFYEWSILFIFSYCANISCKPYLVTTWKGANLTRRWRLAYRVTLSLQLPHQIMSLISVTEIYDYIVWWLLGKQNDVEMWGAVLRGSGGDKRQEADKTRWSTIFAVWAIFRWLSI